MTAELPASLLQSAGDRVIWVIDEEAARGLSWFRDFQTNRSSCAIAAKIPRNRPVGIPQVNSTFVVRNT